MSVLVVLIPVSLTLGLGGLVAFWLLLKNGQFSDPEGDASRGIDDAWDDRPRPDR